MKVGGPKCSVRQWEVRVSDGGRVRVQRQMQYYEGGRVKVYTNYNTVVPVGSSHGDKVGVLFV